MEPLISTIPNILPTLDVPDISRNGPPTIGGDSVAPASVDVSHATEATIIPNLKYETLEMTSNSANGLSAGGQRREEGTMMVDYTKDHSFGEAQDTNGSSTRLVDRRSGIEKYRRSTGNELANDSGSSTGLGLTFTPPGSPTPSVPSAKFRNIPKIYTAAGEISHGPPSCLPKGFPDFEDGNLQIVSPSGRTWKLHDSTLRHSSAIFRELIDGQDAGRARKRRKDEVRSVRWKFLMVPWELKPGMKDLRSFKAIDLSSKQPLVPEILNGDASQAPSYEKVYDNLFRCIYNLPPIFSSSETRIRDLVHEAAALLMAAEYLGAGPSVRMPIETNFLRLDQRLFRHIAQHSAEWCDMALRLQSSALFRAAMAHLVGRFDLRAEDGVNKDFLKSLANGALLMEFAGKKADQLLDQKMRIERLLMEYYPPSMHHPTIHGVAPAREAYTNDIYNWQALTIVRHYFTSAMLANMHHRAPDGGAWFYQMIDAGGEGYLRKDLLEQFHEKFGMSVKGKECLKAAVYFMKETMREIVAPLIVDNSGIHREEGASKPRYLTCTEIRDEELPWNMGMEED